MKIKMWRPRKRSHGEIDGFRRKDKERGRPRCKVDDLHNDSREISPKRRRITDERGGRAWTGGTQGTEDPRPLGYKALEEICNSDSIEDGILDLTNKSKRFEALLKTNPAEKIRPDLMKLVIRAIHLCCSPNNVRENAERLLRVVVDSNFLCLHLSAFISKISYYSQLNGNFLPSDLISRLAEIFLELFQRFGRDIVDSIPFAQLSETLRELKDKSLLHEDTEVLEKKILQVREYRDELIRQKIQSARGKEDESQLTPPDNYRDISVIPEAEDLKIHNKPFLRINVVDGSYKDQEHYLDVQFRLLREDFILPLREGIRQLQKDSRALGTTGSSHSNHAQDVHVYRDVTVLYPVCSGKGMVYRIRFDAFHHSVRRVNWDKCKLLKFGSLLCLSRSADGFYRPLFATVENRDPRELRLGELEVRFEGVQLEILNRFVKEKEKFDMVESPAFFESYRHVLEGLQEIEPGELPFHEQIVKCIRDVWAPDYENKTNGFFDMSGIIEDEAEGTAVPQPKLIVDELMLEDHSVVPVNTSREMASVASDSCSIDSDDSTKDGKLAKGRPEDFVNIYDLQRGRESLGFNESQMRAFKMALSKRFAVIQGPPGTGKTYLGLKIARVLLQSSLLWQNEEQHSPILMVSYTNHALDEFLSGLPTEGKVTVDLYCHTPPMLNSLFVGARACQVTRELVREQVVNLKSAIIRKQQIFLSLVGSHKTLPDLSYITQHEFVFLRTLRGETKCPLRLCHEKSLRDFAVNDLSKL